MGEKKNTASLLLRKHMLLKLENAITQKALDMLFQKRKFQSHGFRSCIYYAAASVLLVIPGKKTVKILAKLFHSSPGVVSKL